MLNRNFVKAEDSTAFDCNNNNDDEEFYDGETGRKREAGRTKRV
jgi:hypothetical protein